MVRCEKKSSGREAPAEREARESAKCNERSPPSNFRMTEGNKIGKQQCLPNLRRQLLLQDKHPNNYCILIFILFLLLLLLWEDGAGMPIVKDS